MTAVVSFQDHRFPERAGSPALGQIRALERGRLHEIHCRMQDRASAMAFALAMAETAEKEAIFILRPAGPSRQPSILSGEGLGLLGIDPNRVTIVETGSEVDMLRAGLDTARCPGVGVLVMESQGRFADYDLTASRRLVLAAEASRTGVLILRCDAEPRSSGAHTRWTVASAPSVPLEAGAPGLPSIDADLLRLRGGAAGGRWRLIWDMEHGCFRDAARPATVPGAVVSFPSLRTDAEEDGQRASFA